MAAAARAYRHEEISATPRGYKVRTVQLGGHVVRIAFPPGRRRKGAGQVVEILHPKGENNPSCIVSNQARKNPHELIIFGNPSKLERQRGARERAARIRGARLNPKAKLTPQEDRAWTKAFQFHIDAGKSDAQADRLAWSDLKKEFPRLRKFSGAKANPDHYEVVEISESGTPRTASKALPRGEAKKLLFELRAVRDRAHGKWTLFMRRVKNPVHMQVFHDPSIKKFTAVIYDPKFGNLYASGFTKKQAAQALRDRVREYRRSGKLPAGGGYGNPRRRNPDETKLAVRLFEKFHGRDPKEITEKHVSAAMRMDYTALGDLQKLRVRTPIGQIVDFNFNGDGVKLASSPEGKQLYCIGGNQNLTACLDAKSLEKDFVDLGEALQVDYLARKVHGNFEPIVYYHKFGENTGERPQLAYDKLKKQIFFVGGNYFIDTTKRVSPGIEN